MKTNITIWGRDYELETVMDCYDGEEVIPEQEEALAQLLEAGEELDKAQEAVREYVRAEYPEFTMKPNIFTFCVPKSIFVKHSKARRAAVICHFKPDRDHGLAICFEDGKLGQVGPEDIIY